MLRDLGSEWQRLVSTQEVIDQVNSWGLPHTPICHLDEALALAGFGRDNRDSEADRYLFLLVSRAATDDLAARIVLQRLLPPLVSVARRRGKITVGGFDEAFTETIAQAWLLIRTYPLDRRPARVASNLVRDTEYHAFVRPTRYRRFTVQLCDSNELSEFPAEASNDDKADALQDLLHGPVRERLSQRSVELLDELSAGTTVEEIAARRGVRVRTVRTWRRAAINELRGRMRSAA